jgi:hypothetical protein
MLNWNLMPQHLIPAVVHKSAGNDELTYTMDYHSGFADPKMEHLACFSGGMFALGAHGETSEEHFEIGKGITHTCHLSYHTQRVFWA